MAGPTCPKTALSSRDRQVADDVEHVAAPDRIAGHERDHDLRHRADELLEVEDVEPRHPVAPDVARAAPDALVAARAEGILPVGVGARARQEDDADPLVVARVAECLDHLRDRLRPEGVPLLGLLIVIFAIPSAFW
jgi:hypothetical protein